MIKPIDNKTALDMMLYPDETDPILFYTWLAPDGKEANARRADGMSVKFFHEALADKRIGGFYVMEGGNEQ